MANKTINGFSTASTSDSTHKMLVQKSDNTTESLLVRRNGYHDLKPTGGYTPGGAASPSVSVFIAPLYELGFDGSGTNNIATYRFHIPHDFVEGSDFFFHVHWALNTVSPTGNVKWKVTWRYAQGYEHDAFDTQYVTTLPDATVSSTQYAHHITESAAVTPASMSGKTVRTDGMIIASLERDTTDTNNDTAFMLEFDIHYLSDGTATVAKDDLTGTGFVKV